MAGSCHVDLVTDERAAEAIAEILKEYARALRIHGPLSSASEGLAVIREEYLELEREVFWGKKERLGSSEPWLVAMEHEAVQVAAMALRFLVEVANPNG